MAVPGAAGPTRLGSLPCLVPPLARAASSGFWLVPLLTLGPGGGTTHFTVTPVHASQSPRHGGVA